MSEKTTMVAIAMTRGIVEIPRFSATSRGMFAAIASSTTMKKNWNLRYRNSAMNTVSASDPSRKFRSMPALSSTSSGALARPAAAAISARSTISRVRLVIFMTTPFGVAAGSERVCAYYIGHYREHDPRMSKAFTRERDAPEERPVEPKVPRGLKNYITPEGHARLKSELKALVETERPELVKTVAWAASNGDRSENADYLYGKKRLREIERRIRFLIKRLEIAEVVDPRDQDQDRVFFGATVTYRDGGGGEHTVSIVGTDEVDPARGRVSWVSPIARALLKTREGDAVTLSTPAGDEQLEVLRIRYEELK